MKLVLSTLCLFALVGAARLQDDAPPPQLAPQEATVAYASTAEPASQLQLRGPYCPRHWTCNLVNWYSSEGDCLARCSSPSQCALEYHCNGSCLCP